MKPEYRGKSNVSYQTSTWDSDIATKHGFNDSSTSLHDMLARENGAYYGAIQG